MCFMQDVHSFQPQRLAMPRNWRDDPTLTNSDMTIEVVRARGNTVERFPVHRTALTTGPGRSRYFGDVLKPEKSLGAGPPPAISMPLAPKGGQSVTVRITLDDRVVSLIPQFLDYVYSLPSFRLTTANVSGLRFLADLLKMPQLQDLTWNFIRNDMNRSNLVTYLAEASYYGDSQISSWVAYEFAENMADFDETSPILSAMAPNDFKEAVSLARMCRTCDPSHTARLVAAYCTAHIDSIDENIFRELTCSENIVIADRTIALKFMELEFLIMRRDSSTAPQDHLSCLQRRCVKALAEK